MAKVTEEKRLNMVGERRVHREHQPRVPELQRCREAPECPRREGDGLAAQWSGITFAHKMKAMVGDLNVCSKKGLCGAVRLHHRRGHRADALRRRLPADPPQNAMVAKLPVDGETNHLLRHGMGLQPPI